MGTSKMFHKYIEHTIKGTISELLGSSSDTHNLDASFLELGINSVQAVELVEAMNEKLGIELGVEVMFDYRGVKELTAFIFQHYGKEDHSQEFPPRASDVRLSERENVTLDDKTLVSATPIDRDENHKG